MQLFSQAMNFANKHGKHNLRGNGVYDMLVNAYTAHADRFIETKRKLDRCIKNNETLPPRIMKRWKSMLKRAKDQGCKVMNADRSRGTACVEYKHQNGRVVKRLVSLRPVDPNLDPRVWKNPFHEVNKTLHSYSHGSVSVDLPSYAHTWFFKPRFGGKPLPVHVDERMRRGPVHTSFIPQTNGAIRPCRNTGSKILRAGGTYN